MYSHEVHSFSYIPADRSGTKTILFARVSEDFESGM